MKTILVIFFFLITGVVYSQIHYVEVSPKSVKQYEHKEGYFDNAALFRSPLILWNPIVQSIAQ